MRRAAACCVVAAGALVAGCAQPGYDAPKLERQLRRAGLTDDQAACLTAGMESTFDARRLASYSEPTAQELERTRAILERCGVTPRPT